MLKVRTGAFETNSSSMHSIAIKCNKKGISPEQYAHMISRWYEDDELIPVRFNDFGWGPYAYIKFEHKLSYLVTLIKEVNGISLPGYWGAPSGKTFDDVKTEIENTEEWGQINDIIYEHTGLRMELEPSEGYVDHQSVRSINHFLENEGVDLFTFLFDKNYVLIIDNDNH